MRNQRKFLFIKIGLVLAAVPAIIHAYASGPIPGVTGAPGDKTCIQSSCHVGTANTGGGSVSLTLPNKVTTYTPGGGPIAITLLITDTSMRSYGFEMTARSGSGNTTQAGALTSTDANTQVICPDGSTPVKGVCPASFPIQDIEHTLAGWSNSINSKGSYTYTFNWTPPATNVGNVTMYVAANCGTGTDSQTPTHVYISNFVLTPAAVVTGPTIANVLDAASGAATVVPGAWTAIYGSALAGTTRAWAAADFNGNNLPTALDKVSVQFGTLPASVFFVSPAQLDVQVPSGVSGKVPVTVTYNGTVSTSFTATVASAAPSLFVYSSGSNTFAAAQNFPSYTTVGDPGVVPGTAKATAGQTVILYLNGLGSSPSGTLISPAINYSGPTVTATLGSTSPAVTYAGLVAAGLFQVNITVPTGLAAGTYPLAVSAGGFSTQSGVTLIVGP